MKNGANSYHGQTSKQSKDPINRVGAKVKISVFAILLGCSVVFLYRALFLSFRFILNDPIHEIGTNRLLAFCLNDLVLIILTYMFSDKLFQSFSDLLDINDILFVISDIQKETKQDFLGNEFRKEIWNQINRRAEKEKIASLKSLDSRFAELRDWIKPFLPKG